MSKCKTYLLYALHLEEQRLGVGRECAYPKQAMVRSACFVWAYPQGKNLGRSKRNGILYYIPLRYKEVRKQGKKRIITKPLLPSLIFVHASAEQVETLLHNIKIVANESRALLSYYFDHTIHLQDNPNRNPPLTIQDEVMNNFICLTSIKNPHIIPVTSNSIKFKLGDNVVVTEGEFKGVHGRVARIAGQQRVIVELFDECLVATAYVPREAMKKYE